MITNLKTPKQIFFICVCIISIISAYLFLITIKSNNRKFNQNLLSSTLTLFSNHLENFNKLVNSSQIIGRKTLLPFKLDLIMNPEMKLIEYIESENMLRLNTNYLEDSKLKKIIELLYKFSVIEKNITETSTTKQINYIPIDHKVQIYKHVNIWFLIHEEENVDIYYNFVEKFYNNSSIGSLNKIFVKFLNYDKFNGVIQAEELYKDLKNNNPKLVFEELNDADSLNILLFSNKNQKGKDNINVYYNKDINNDIYSINFEMFDNRITLEQLLNIRTLEFEIKNSIEKDYSQDFVAEIIKLHNSKHYYYNKLITSVLNKLDKINKIFPLYESIRTIEHVKEKFNNIQNKLITIVKNNFDVKDLDLIMNAYLDTKYLMESNELVSFEHYFSNEFKIGMFLPVMLPIVYGFVKALKALTT